MGAATTIMAYLGEGLAANRPATPSVPAGATAIYFETDTDNTFIWSGSAWVQVNGSSPAGTEGIPAFSPPLAAHFPGATTSGGTAISLADDPNYGLLVTCNTTVGGDVPKFVYKTVTNPTWTITARLSYQALPSTNNYGGIVLADSVGGKCLIFGFINNNGNAPSVVIINDNIAGGHNSNVIGANACTPGKSDIFFEVQWNGTDLIFSTSVDGSPGSYIQQASVSLSGAGLANAPNRIGLGWGQGAAVSTVNPAFMSVPYWADNA